MLEVVAALSWLEIAVAVISILAAIGGLMNRAFIKPLKEDIEDLKENHEDQETRLRTVEYTQAAHGIEITTVKEVAMKLVDRMDKILDRFTSKDIH
jgi:hypothetical protein